ncbi:MAG: ribonuclease R [Nitrospirae bacterium]|nr:ribonuclease R [Nitrospirota bacterium]
MVNKEAILLFYRKKSRRPLSFKDMVSYMKLSRSEARSLKKILSIMVREGELVITRKGLYGPPEDMNLITGYFEPHKEGYGFVVMEKPGERDLFIPPWATLGAMNNDRVLVRVENWTKREGRIIRILERFHTRIAGKLEATSTGFYVRPKNKSVHLSIYIPPRERGTAKRGDIVVAEITSYPKDRKPPAGRILKVLGKPEDPKAEIESIIEELNLPKKFPRNVLEETRSLYKPALKGAENRIKRKDLRSLRTVTIDGEHAKDFDDALSVKIEKHGYKLYVHIADVGFYVDWNSGIDVESRKRGTSVYFPDRVLPMLPKDLSEELCSLKPKVERLAFTVEMDFDRGGDRIDAKFYPSVIISDERMTYTSIKKILVDNDKTERGKYDYLLRDFEQMGKLCGILRDKRLERGSLDFDLPEPEVLLDIKGSPESILAAERNFAHTVIEEFMIAANEAVAEYLDALGAPLIYRVHEEPDPMKFEYVERVIKSLYGTKLPLKPKDYSELLKKIKFTPEEEIINYLILRSLKQARYSNINVGHFGLASKCYTHFTSPIRRYPDLIVHRILREVLNKKHISDRRIRELNKILPDIAFHSSRMERLADEAEKEVVNAMRVWFMKDKVGEQYNAKVVNVTPYGLKVRLKDYFIEGFLHVSYMTDDFYQYNERSLSLAGRHTKRMFKIGNELRVRIDRVDMEEREIILDICDYVSEHKRKE